MVLQSRSMKSRSFHLECENIGGEPLIVSCRSSNSLCCEIEVCPTSSERGFLLSFLVVVVGACVALWISDVQSVHSTWIFVSSLLSLMTLWIKYNYFDVIKESATIVKNIGIQIKTTYKTGRQAVQFVDHESVADIIINEAITMHKVIFYVAILTRNSENKQEALQLLPLFTSFYPRLEGLKPIYHSIRSIIFNDCDQEESWPDHILDPNDIS